MKFYDVTFTMPPSLVEGLGELAKARGQSTGQVLRALVLGEVRAAKAAGAETLTPRIAPLQRRLVAEMARARSWDDLSERLAYIGCRFEALGDGLSILTQRGVRFCDASDLGVPLAHLVRRFGPAPLPSPDNVTPFPIDIAAEADPDGDENIFADPVLGQMALAQPFFRTSRPSSSAI